ncbi:SRPBCC family protein [Streptomyces sp. XM4193]|uniref:SRPBCC family protein n=1 Tax=Streptomyces sp. XM4193 TaxID=2929782 RepID=UPI001FFA4079|nr:SRPBCC family protein [Streptomyces sp. XM4193]MCK1798587.1 SRPBCC family protein [Streptomyces sp. XM4193]
MKYTVSIEIALPREQVLRLLEDPEHRAKWLEGLVLHEPLRGEDGQVGTESRVVFRTGKQTMECTETITRREPEDMRNVPSDRVVHYEREIVGNGMWSAARERLTESGPEGTLWASENEYRFTGPMRFVAPLLRGVFTKQSRKVMRDFKAFAEQGTDVRDAKG